MPLHLDDFSPAILVARFLRTNNYTETLSAFLREAGLPPDAGVQTSSSKDVLTIEKVLEEKRLFDLSVGVEKVGVEGEERRWKVLVPSVPTVLSLPTSTNLLCTSIERLLLSEDGDETEEVLLSTTADRRLNVMVGSGSGFMMSDSHLNIQDSPILSYAAIRQRYLVLSSMSGKIVVWDFPRKETLAERKDHNRYVVKIASHEVDGGDVFIATAGWDAKINIYLARVSENNFDIGEPIATITLPTNPEDIVFVRHPDTQDLYLISTRRDSSCLFYHRMPSLPRVTNQHIEIPASVKQNLAPYSKWVAFTPAAIAISPIDPTLIAVATSAIPHMRLLIVRLLFPTEDTPQAITYDPTARAPESTYLATDQGNSNVAAVQQARAALALQDREAAAIKISVATMSPQSAYSTPALAWRPDGSGIWVNSDDGLVRGIEATTGKIITSLEGHDVGCKIRCLWAGTTNFGSLEKSEEVVVSGGFDQHLISWHQKQE